MLAVSPARLRAVAARTFIAGAMAVLAAACVETPSATLPPTTVPKSEPEPLPVAAVESTQAPAPIETATPIPVAPSPPPALPGPAADTRLAGQTRYIANTEGIGVKIRSACDDQTGTGGWPEGARVTVEFARADCPDWMLVARADHGLSWIRVDYLSDHAPPPVPLAAASPPTVSAVQAPPIAASPSTASAAQAPTVVARPAVQASPRATIGRLTPIAAAPSPSPPPAAFGTLCNDGWVSPSTGSGTCSSHGGIADGTPPGGSGQSCYGCISPSTGRPQTVYVPGYTRKDGTNVSPHYRSAPRRR